MNAERAKEILSRFEKARVLVVGDIYLDENVYGSVTEVSLEAPIPVYEVHERRYNPGAAGNAACNVAALGAKTYMVGVTGDDINAGIVRREFEIRNVDISHIVTDPSRATNTYGKLRAGGYNIPEQEILRTDTPTPTWISGAIEDQVIANIEKLAPRVDAIVVTDQVKSMATERVLTFTVEMARKYNLLTVGDSRGRAADFKGFKIMVPNDRETGVAVGIEVTDDASLEAAAKKLLESCETAMITCGPKGITIFERNGRVTNSPAHVPPREVADVTGAGDTVTAAVTVSLLSGATLEEAAEIANTAAGIAVRQKGVVTVPKAELEHALLSAGGPAKVKTLEELQAIVKRLQAEGKTVVWTNGCFDIIHAGHVSYLLRAGEIGDALIVGLNSDASVRAVKGPKRPVIPQDERALVLSAFECVDYITIFDGESPIELLKTLKPDVYAKGGDYNLDTIVQPERRLVESYGGRIAIVPGTETHSTTAIIKRIHEE